MAHNSVDKQARLGKSESRDTLEFAELELMADFFLAWRLFASTRGSMRGHGAESAGRERVLSTGFWGVYCSLEFTRNLC